MTDGFSRVVITGSTSRTKESGFYIIYPLDLSSVDSLENRKPETDLKRNLDPMRFARLEKRNGEVEEVWYNRFSGRSRASRKWVGFSAFWEEGYAPGAPEERIKRASGNTRTRKLAGPDYEQDMPCLERPYANSGKPNSILSEDWRDLSCNQREAYLEYDKRRILERVAKARTDCEKAIEESQESWRSVGNRTWIARPYIAPRLDGVPEHFRVWARYDSDASTMKGTRSGGPSRGSILHRVTRHADSREEIMSEPIPANTESEDPEIMARKLVRQQDIITELWYEPEVTEPTTEGSSASGLRTGGRDRLEVGREKTRESGDGPGKPPAEDERQEDDDAAPAPTERELGDEGRDGDEEGELMDERDAMAGPAVGIVRNPFRYGEDGYPTPVTERRGKFIEFACDPQSRLSQVVAARGVGIVRVDKTTGS